MMMPIGKTQRTEAINKIQEIEDLVKPELMKIKSEILPAFDRLIERGKKVIADAEDSIAIKTCGMCTKWIDDELKEAAKDGSRLGRCSICFNAGSPIRTFDYDRCRRGLKEAEEMEAANVDA